MVLRQRPGRTTDDDDKSRSDLLEKIVSLNIIDKVVPVISNSFRIEQIFRDDNQPSNLINEVEDYDYEGLTIEQQLTGEWSKEIRYPMGDPHNLARVAQYYQVKSEDSDMAKREYVEFLKNYLLDMNSEEPKYQDIVRNMRSESWAHSFPEIARELGYPRLPEGAEDPLNLLAKMPFPIYITTSYYDFLERALIKEGGKKPRTEVIAWEDRKHDEPNVTYPEPTITEPVVYHLFGMENDPRASLVLSEDDYMKFLVTVVSDTDTQNPIVPSRLRRVLAASHLLMLGYHLKEWDFRVLFRFILNYRIAKSGKKGIFIQLMPKRGDQNLLDYLKDYFEIERFEISWKSSERFIQELWEIWKGQQM
jgi:hypothetical protein